MDNQFHLDLLQLYKNSQNELSFFDLDENGEDSKRNLHLLDAFMAKRPVDVAFEKEYVSPLMIEDIANHTYYPLCFFKVKQDSRYLVYDEVLPELNHACMEFLQEMKIPFEENFAWSEISSWYTQIHSYIYMNDLTDKVKIIPYFTFYDKEVLVYNSNYEFLNNYIFGKENAAKYDSLFKEIRNEETETKIKDNTFGFFAREQRVLERLYSYGGAKTLVEGKLILNDFLGKVIDTSVEKKESLLLVIQPEEKEELIAFLKENDLSDLSLDLASVPEMELVSRIENVSRNDISPADDIKIRKMNEKEEQYIDFLENQLKNFSYPKEFLTPTTYHDFVSNYSPDLELNLFDVEDYTEDDTMKAKTFFTELDQLSTVKFSYVSNHPFYGLSLSENEESYQHFRQVLSECKGRLEKLLSVIENNRWIQDYHWQIENLQECREVIQHGKILSQYNGFPRKYFRIQEDSESKYDLAVLKKAFQSVSSCRLLMNSLFGQKIFQENIPQILLDYHNPSYLVQRKAKKVLASYVSYQKEADYETVVTILETYLKSVQSLSDILPKYREIYGDNVSNMNGVVEIESNVKYIKLFKEHQRQSRNFSTEEPCIKRCLKDKTFRLQVISDLNDISLCLENFIQSLKDFNNCFLDSKEILDEEMSFAEILQRLNVFEVQSYDTYYQYAHFREVLNGSSTSLQLMVRKNMAKKKTMERFRRDYYLSLLKSFQYQFESQQENFAETYLQNSVDYLDALSQEQAFAPKKRYSLILQHIEKYKTEEEYQQLESHIQEMEEKSALTPQLKAEMMKLLLVNYPISYITSDELYRLPDDVVDTAIIINSSTFDSLQLISSYRISQKKLFISYGKESDKRILGYHETTLNKESLYYRSFDYSSIYDTLVQQTKKLGEEVNASLFPFAIQANGKKFALVPDLLVKYPMDGHSLLELARFLAREEQLYLFDFSVYFSLFDDQDIYQQILQH